MKRITFAVATTTTLIGCTAELLRLFDPSEVAYIHARGTNTIEGNAFIRQMGGGLVTCAGEQVFLIPAGEYARERMRLVYGTDARPAYAKRSLLAKKPSSTGAGQYWEYQRDTKCDSEGRFRFEGVAVGSYFVTTRVLWSVSAGGYFWTEEGGALMAPVEFNGAGRTRSVVLSP